MKPCIRVLRNSLLSLALMGTISGPTSAAAQSVSSEETVLSVRRLLEFRTTVYSITSSSESIAALSTSPATASKGG
jgi:hypothetical protein